jgi:hypothetical protein
MTRDEWNPGWNLKSLRRRKPAAFFHILEFHELREAHSGMFGDSETD